MTSRHEFTKLSNISSNHPCTLSIETSSDLCSVSITHQQSCYQVAVKGIRASSHLLSLIEIACSLANRKNKDIETIAFGNGPGGFTGLRIASSVSNALALSWGIPCYGISSLKAYAYGYYLTSPAQNQTTEVGVIVDARQGEVYTANYLVGDLKVTTQQASFLCQPGELERKALFSRSAVILGDGANSYPEMADHLSTNLYLPHVKPSATAIAAIFLLDYDNHKQKQTIHPNYVKNEIVRSHDK